MRDIYLRRVFLASTLLALLLGAISPSPLRAQVVKGSISGTVMDTTGAVVPGADVSAVSSDSGASYTTKSEATGNFKLPLLSIGKYTLTISKEGFRNLVLSSVQVTAAADYGLGNLTLEVGQASTTVEVSAAPPLMQTTQSQITTSITGSEIATFPGLEGNTGLDQMALILPGVVNSRDNNFANYNGVGFSVNGLRGRSNDQQIDGQTNNDNSVTGPGLFVGNTDIVQEYQVTTNNFGAEYGRNSGSVVNIITKSGTNNWHGDVFGVESNNKLNTLSNTQKAFEGLTSLPVLNDEYSGGSIGGPIIKDKLFVFGAFDNEIIPGSGVFSTGNLTPDPTGIQQLQTCFPNSTSLQALAAYGPFGVKGGNPQISGTPQTSTVTVNGTTCNFEESGVQRLLSQSYHQYDTFERLDYNSDKNRIYGRFIWQKTTPLNQQGDQANGYSINVPSFAEQWGLSWTRTISPSMFNEVRFSYGRETVQFGGNDIGNTVPTISNLAGGLASISMPKGYAGFGPANNLPQGRIINTYQVQDNWSYIYGRHQFKAGTNLTYQRSPNVFLPNYNGTFSFTNFAGFIANTPSSISVTLGNPNLDFREHDSFFYFGDDYKVRPNLTLNLGLTYTYFGQPANLFHDYTTKRESGSQPFFDPSLPLSVRTFPSIPAPKTAFGPGIGFAYSPSWGGWLTGNGKTTLRGGYRLAYDPPFYNIYLNIASATPQVLAQTLTGATAAAIGLPAVPTGPNIRSLLSPYLTLGVADPRSYNQTTITPNFGPDHVQSWSFGIQRELGPHAVVETRYVGNHGGSLFQSINGNPKVDGILAAFPNALSGVTPCPASEAVVPRAVGRVNCNLGVQRVRTNTGVSDYEAWQTEFRTNNLWNQLTMRTSYTLSKTTDNVSEIFGTGGGGNTLAFSQDPLNYIGAEHGLSGLNIPQAWTLSFVEDIPFMRDQKGIVGHVLGGWQLTGSYLISSGEAYTPIQYALADSMGGTAFDVPFNTAFAGQYETLRPFAGGKSAPVSQVGIYAPDACAYAGVGCGLASTALLSFNAVNTTGAQQIVSPNAVRFIVNGPAAESIYGTPWGNVGRNPVRDYQTNSANFALFKYIKVTERVKVRFDATFINVFNHPNFYSIDPYLDDAGLLQETTGFGVPSLWSGTTSSNGQRQIKLGLRVDF